MYVLRSATLRLVLAAALASAGCIQFGVVSLAPGETTLSGDGGALPAQWVRQFAFLEVSLDGGAPRRFLLDTGASSLVVTPAVAAELSRARGAPAAEARDVRITGADDAVGTAHGIVRIAELRCGPLTVHGIDALVVDLDLPQAALGAPFDGILPGAAAGDALLSVDYPARVVTLVRGELPADAPDVLPLEGGPMPVVSLELGGRTGSFLVDTGSGEFLNVPEALAPDLALKSRRVRTGSNATLAGFAPRQSARLDGRVRLGSHRLADPVVTFTPAQRGRIGAELLASFRVTIDLAHGRIRFERASADPIVSPPVRSTGVGFLRRGGEWTIGYVLDGTPAAASGLKAGDRIVSIDGRPVEEIQTPDAPDRLLTAESLRLGIADATGVREVVVPVVTLVE